MSDNRALAIVPRTVPEVRELAAQFARSALLPPDLRGKEADVFVTILAGQELGIPPMAALRSIHVVKGKPVLSADAMVGVVLSSGIADYFLCVEESPTSVTYETKRRGAPGPQRCTWTIEDAQRAGLAAGDNWKRYPRAMLKARCKAVLARDVYPDVLAGCYDEDEARDFSPRTAVAEAVDAEIVDETPPATRDTGAPRSFVDLVESCTSDADLRARAFPIYSAMPKGSRARTEAYELLVRRRQALSDAAAAQPGTSSDGAAA